MKKLKLTFIFSLLTCYVLGQTDKYTFIEDLYNQGKYKDAIEYCTTEIKNLKGSDSLYRKILVLRVGCYMATSDFKSAINDYNSLIVSDTNYIQYYLGLSFAYWQLNDVDNCFKSIHKAYELNPKDIGTLNNMSYFYGQAGKFNESINYANQGIALEGVPNTIKDAFYNNRGYAYWRLKQYDKALADINKAILLNPQNSFAYFYRALVNIDLKKMGTVCQDLEKSKNLGGINLTRNYIKEYCKN